MSEQKRKEIKAGEIDTEIDSVYDFLYNDSRRIGSFLAQFDNAGTLERVTHSEAAIKGKKRGWNASIGGGLREFGNASVSFGNNPSSEGSETSERIYDPLWSNALTLLDYLSSKLFLHRDIGRARMGHFVLAFGELSIIDLTLMKRMWELPAMRTQAVVASSGSSMQPQLNRKARRQDARRGSSASQTDPGSSMAAEVLGVMPHAMHALLHGDGYQVWCTLKEESLIATSGDIFLKHGVHVPGDWNMVGVLDALPDNNDLTVHEGGVEAANSYALGMEVIRGGFGAVVSALGPIVRTFLGRPAGAYGITPLLIFRKISGG